MIGHLRHISAALIGCLAFKIQALNGAKLSGGRVEVQISAEGVEPTSILGEEVGELPDMSLPGTKLLQFLIDLLQGQSGKKHRSIVLSGMHSHIDSDEGNHLLKLEEERTKNRWQILKTKGPEGKSYFSNGPWTPMVPYEMYKSHRHRFMKRLKEKLSGASAQDIGFDVARYGGYGRRLGAPARESAQISQGEEYNIVMFEGGTLESVYGTDIDAVFRQEPNFLWLFGVREPNVKAAIDLRAELAYLFVPFNGDEFKLMSGMNATGEDGLNWWREKYEIDHVYHEKDMERVIGDLIRTYERGNGTSRSNRINRARQTILSDRQHSAESNKSDLKAMSRRAHFNLKVDPDRVVTKALRELRAVKDDWEIQIMQFVNDVTAEGHIAAMQQSALATRHPGLISMEWAAEATFRYIALLRGCREVQYEASCGGGSNAAFMHYSMDQWEPNSEMVHPGEFRMLDLSAAYAGYTADVASSYPEDGKFNEQQKLLYDALLEACAKAEEVLRPGQTWGELYRVAEEVLLTHMKAAGILTGDIKTMVAAGLLRQVFMPHLLGHSLGMDPHDPGHGPLQVGMVVTIEPSLYFIPRLMKNLEKDPVLSSFVDMKRLKEFIPVGGMRTEDNLVITENGCTKFTRVPRKTEDIEAIMNEKVVWRPWEKEIEKFGNPTRSHACDCSPFYSVLLIIGSWSLSHML